MTRETKIGLLVGLAFIIVIGILLSDHLNGASGTPQATLTQTGPGVRQTFTAPGTGQAPPIVGASAPQNVQPNRVVPGAHDLIPQTPANEVIKVGSSSTLQQQTQGVISVQTQPQQTGPAVTYVPNPQPQQQVAEQTPIRVAQQPQQLDEDDAIRRIAEQNGEQLVTITPSGNVRPIVSTGNGASASATGTRDYVAEEGDSLSKIAQKFLGSGGKAARDAIVKVNPSLQQNPDMVVVGKTYKIPSSIGAPTQTPAQTPPQQIVNAQQTTQQPQQQRQVVSAPQPKPAPSNEIWYTVQPGDTLWKIANEQLSNPGAVSAIKELNKETLNGGDRINVNMKLRLPGKTVVQAN